jgi:hypothetical protein
MRILRRAAARILAHGSLRTDVKVLFQAALALLALAVVLGAIQVQNRQPPSPDQSAIHSGAGTWGWIMLGVVALSLMLFGGGTLSALEQRYARLMSGLTTASVACYVLALVSGNALVRVVCSAALLLSIVSLLGWLGMRSAQIHLGLPQVALVLASIALVFAATIGMLLEVQSAASASAATIGTFFPGDTASARPVVFVSGYLMLAGMAVSEWRLQPTSAGWSWQGVAQVALAFLAAVALGIGLLLDIAGAASLALVFDLASGVFLVMRFAPRMRDVRWLERGSERHFALGSIFLVAYMILFVYLLGTLAIRAKVSYGEIPLSVTGALDHLMFLGAMTNALVGLLTEMTCERRRFWPATEDLLFWGLNLGLLGFVIGLALGSTTLGQTLQGLFSPILAASLLVGIVAYSVRLQTARVRIEMPEAVRFGG